MVLCAQIPPNGPQYDCRGACAVSVYDKMFKTAAGNAITACLGTVPGYWFTVAFVDTIGRVPIQFMGESWPAPACYEPSYGYDFWMHSDRGVIGCGMLDTPGFTTCYHLRLQCIPWSPVTWPSWAAPDGWLVSSSD